MRPLTSILTGILLALLGQATGSAQAGAPVELIVVTEARVATDVHDWLRMLTKAGAAHVRIRGSQPNDQVGVEVQGSAERPAYVVTAMITARGELVVPGARFGRNDGARLSAWLAELAARGPADRREPTSAFGLTAKQYDQVRADLAQPAGTTTLSAVRSEVVQALGRRLQFRVQFQGVQPQSLGDDKVAEELSGFSCGTALACLLRPAGLCLVPVVRAGEPVYAIVESSKAGREIWPVGWEPEKPARDVVPALYEFLTVNIQGVTAARAANAIAQRLKVPLLLDHNALARHGIDLEKVQVSVPRGRTTHSLVLHKILFQARVKEELRVDESGKPFLWVTSIKPM